MTWVLKNGMYRKFKPKTIRSQKALPVPHSILIELVFPLEVRIWRPGDQFRPLGMDNHKKISDFLIDVESVP